ncbi:S8 family serine peptidase, partial [candidate division TA06 bacterium]|nr:S8 family serine peptidase [candidate division TA06 bacterium]
MNRKGCLSVLTLLLPLNGIFASQQNQSPAEAGYLPGEVILFFEEEARERLALGEKNGIATLGIPTIDDLNETFQVFEAQRLVRGTISEIGKQYGMDLLYHLFLPEDTDILMAVEAYKKHSLVFDAFPNVIYQPLDTPNDPLFSSQWALPKIKAPEAWDIQKGNSSIVLSIIDTGNDWDHPDLEGNLWINTLEDFNGNGTFENYSSGSGGDLDGVDNDGNGFIDDVIGWDFTGNDPNPTPGGGGFNHGTWVSGIANMVTDNGMGGAGIPWNCRTMAFRCAPLFTSCLINTINYSANNGAHVINMSWGGGFNSGINNALQAAHAAGLVLCASAGNGNTSNRLYPAANVNVIAVAATNSSDQKSSYSSYGTWVDVCAPGDGILGAGNGGGYVSTSGTSASSPVVAGAIALLRSQNPAWTNFQIENLLFTS